MSRRFVRVLAAMAPAALASCAPAVRLPPTATPATATDPSARAPFYAVRETPDAPFRAHAPAVADAPPPFAPPPVRSFRLANGIPVQFREQHTPGLLRVEVMLHAQPAPLGANEMAARGVWLGTPAMDGSKLQAANDADGAVMTTQYAWGWLRVGVTVPSDRVASSVARLASVVLDASFPAGPYVSLARQVMSEAEPSDDALDAIARRLAPLVLYAPSPASSGASFPREDDPTDLRSSDVGGLARDPVADAYAAALDPSAATVVVVGDSTEEALKPALEKAFGGWHAKRTRARASWTRPALAASTPRLVVVDRPGGESILTFVGEGPRYSTPEWAALCILRPLLTGERGRIAGALRSAIVDRTSATIGLYEHPLAPRVAVHVRVPTAQTGTALAALDGLLRQTKSGEIAPDELARARRSQLIGLQAMTATVAGAAEEMEGLVVQGLSPNDVPKRAPRYVALTSGDLQRAGARYLDPDRMKVVVVGDWARMREQVEALGWGPVELRSPAGAVLGVEGAEAPR